MAATTRLGFGGYGVRRAGSFADKVQAIEAISDILDLGIVAALYDTPIEAKLYDTPIEAKLYKTPITAKLS